MRNPRLVVATVALVMIVGGCDSGSSDTGEARFRVGPELVDCVGVGPQKCLLVKEAEDGDWQFLYDGIEGFEHTEGVSYVLDVEIIEVRNPPADGSSLRYRLVGIVESTPAGG